MKILFYNPAPAQKRFVPFEAIKGSAIFRRPNYDAMRLAALSRQHDFIYYDERTEDKPDLEPDIAVVNIPLNLSRYVQTTIRKKWSKKTKIISYGFLPTLFPQGCKKFSDSVVIGDIVNIWDDLLADALADRIARVYRSNRKDKFHVDRSLETKYGFTPVLSQLRTSFGCTCSKEYKDFCFEHIIYKKLVHWDITEAITEVKQIRRKIIHLRDDDFLHNLDYAVNFLEKTWRYKKMWMFQTTGRLFEQPDLISILRENGVRIIFLKEDWLGQDLVRDLDKPQFIKEKKRQVAMLHNNRITCGCRLRLGFIGENFAFYRRLLRFLINIKMDLIKVTVQTPMPKTETHREYKEKGFIAQDLTLYDRWMPVVQIPGITPQALYSWMEWLRDSFYSWDSILYRNILVSPKLGVYNTLLFYLVPNLSYRNNFLEKVGYPP